MEEYKMAISLSKGQKISLSKAAADSGVAALSKVCVGLGWDTNQYDGGHDFDLDSTAFLLGSNGKTTEENVVFYGALNQTADGLKCDKAQSVVHTGDNKTGAGDGDDETIKIDLTKVPADVEKIAITVTIYDADKRRQNFGMVSNSFVRVYDEVTGAELLRYDLGEDYSIETAMVVAELYRHNGEWKFNAVGAGYNGGLKALFSSYGLEVDGE